MASRQSILKERGSRTVPVKNLAKGGSDEDNPMLKSVSIIVKKKSSFLLEYQQ